MNTPILAELDPVQIAIVVIAMLGGFAQWLWSLLQQGKKEAAERRAAPPNPEEKKLREEAWRRQTQGQASPRPSPPPLKPAMNDPFATVKEIFEQIKRDAMEAQRPSTPAAPPPLPPAQARPPKRHSVRAELTSPATVHSPKRHSVSAELASTNDTPPVVLPISQPESFPAPHTATSVAPAWAGLLGSPAALRQAFILREILGPPKALQTTGDSPV